MTGKKVSDKEKLEYVVAVIEKQAEVSAEEAAKMAKKLSKAKRDALHAAGRAGRVAECRKILGLDP